MVDLRYLVITLSGIFLALGIGIVIGTTLVPQTKIAPLLLNKQKQMIASLEKNFRGLREEGRKRERELKEMEQWSGKILPFALQSRLTGQKFCLVYKTNTSADLLSGIKRTLLEAGAEDIVALALSGLELLEDPVFLKGLAGQLGLKEEKKSAILEQVASRLGKELLLSEHDFLAYLVEKQLLSVEGQEGLPCSSVLLFLDGNETDEELVHFFLLPFSRPIMENHVRLVTVEPLSSKKSYLPLFARAGVSTLKGVDQKRTKLTLVLLFSGYEGHFGIGDDKPLLPAPFPAKNKVP